jgi:hypothetical protein
VGRTDGVVIVLSPKKQIQTMPDERGQKLIIRPTAPSSWLRRMKR